MLTMLQTWQSADVSQQEPYNGDFEAAMKGIKAKALVLPAKTDLYFREFFLIPLSNIHFKPEREKFDWRFAVCWFTDACFFLDNSTGRFRHRSRTHEARDWGVEGVSLDLGTLGWW
jgi:hypothetical protein